MEKTIYHQITDHNYIGVVTILDYDVSVKKCLSDISVNTRNKSARKIIVDLALKVGDNEYRFVAYNVTDDGKILWNSNAYITPGDDIVRLANSFIAQKKEILMNSMLPNTAKVSLLQS